jgi:hypothetical protein
VVEHLHNKCKVLSSNPSTAKKKKVNPHVLDMPCFGHCLHQSASIPCPSSSYNSYLKITPEHRDFPPLSPCPQGQLDIFIENICGDLIFTEVGAAAITPPSQFPFSFSQCGLLASSGRICPSHLMRAVQGTVVPRAMSLSLVD